MCAICWEEKDAGTMVREVVGMAAEPESGKRDRTSHWWRCRQECAPRAQQYTVGAAPWQWAGEGVFMVPALTWLERREQAVVFLFYGESGQRFKCRTQVMREQGRLEEREGLQWVVPLGYLEEG